MAGMARKATWQDKDLTDVTSFRRSIMGSYD